MTRLPSEGIIDVATGLIGDVTTLLVAAVAALVVWFIVKAVWASGGAIGATVVAILVGGFILWAVANLDTVKGWFDDQLSAAPAIGRTIPGEDSALAWGVADPGVSG